MGRNALIGIAATLLLGWRYALPFVLEYKPVDEIIDIPATVIFGFSILLAWQLPTFLSVLIILISVDKIDNHIAYDWAFLIALVFPLVIIFAPLFKIMDGVHPISVALIFGITLGVPIAINWPDLRRFLPAFFL